jgi:hypothetical protein
LDGRDGFSKRLRWTGAQILLQVQWKLAGKQGQKQHVGGSAGDSLGRELRQGGLKGGDQTGDISNSVGCAEVHDFNCGRHCPIGWQETGCQGGQKFVQSLGFGVQLGPPRGSGTFEASC